MSWRDGRPQSSTTTAFPPPLSGGAPRPGPVPVTDLIQSLKDSGGLRQKWIWEGYVPEGGLVILAGSPKAGKSTLARHLAVAVAQGRDFLGLGTKQAKVLWLGLEERSRDVARRFEELGPSENILYLEGPFRAKKDNMALLDGWIRDGGVGLVIVDTLSKFWDGVDDENSAAGVDAALDAILRTARASGAGFVLIHHTRKSPSEDGGDIRGSSAIFGNADTAIVLRREEESGRTVLKSFSRYDETPQNLAVELRDGQFMALGEVHEVRVKEREEALFKALTLEGQTAGAISAKADIAEATVRRSLRKMAKESPSKVIREGGSRRETFRLADRSTTTAQALGFRGGGGNLSPEESALAAVQQVFPGSNGVAYEQ